MNLDELSSIQSKNGLAASGSDSSSPSVFAGLTLRLAPAPLLLRSVAFAVDLALITAMFYLFSIPLGILAAILFATASATLPSAVAAVVILAIVIFFVVLSVAVLSGYFIYLEYTRGATFGKKLFGLSVVSADGARLTLGQAAIRELLRIIDCYLVFPALISVTATERKQRIGDILAGTVVTYSAAKAKAVERRYVTQDEYERLRATLMPKPVPAPFAEGIARYAFQRIALQRNASSGEDERVAQSIKPYLGSQDISNIAALSLIGFFADYCLDNT